MADAKPLDLPPWALRRFAVGLVERAVKDAVKPRWAQDVSNFFAGSLYETMAEVFGWPADVDGEALMARIPAARRASWQRDLTGDLRDADRRKRGVPQRGRRGNDYRPDP